MGPSLAEARQRLTSSLDVRFRRRAVERAAATAARSGITTIHALDGGELFGDGDVDLLLSLRTRCATWIVLYWMTTDVELAHSRGLLRVGGDILLDGTIGSHTAALRKAYADDGSKRGTLYRNQREVDGFFRAAAAAGLQPAVHAIGGRAIAQALRAIERAIRTEHPGGFRPRIEHFAEASRPQVRRAADLNVVVATQPSFPFLRGIPGGIYERRLGSRRVRTIYPLRWLVDDGVRVAGGSDSPVGPCDGILGLHAACNAPHSAQRITAQEALRMYTVDAAWAGLEEGEKGDLRTGLSADMVVLDRDPFSVRADQIQDARVLLTIKGGEVVYDAR
jgi:predicted amidohydrolase YtcJ